jgi:hypothetical protein
MLLLLLLERCLEGESERMNREVGGGERTRRLVCIRDLALLGKTILVASLVHLRHRPRWLDWCVGRKIKLVSWISEVCHRTDPWLARKESMR